MNEKPILYVCFFMWLYVTFFSFRYFKALDSMEVVGPSNYATEKLQTQANNGSSHGSNADSANVSFLAPVSLLFLDEQNYKQTVHVDHR